MCGQILVVQARVGAAARPRGTAQQHPGLADLGTLEEALGAAQLVGHAGVGERLLVDLGLRVHPVQHGDLAGAHALVHQLADPPGGALGLGGLVRVLGVDRLGAGLALRDQLQAVLGGLAAGLGQQPVGEVHHLGVER